MAGGQDVWGEQQVDRARGRDLEEVAKCHDEQGMQGDQPAWLQTPLCLLPAGSPGELPNLPVSQFLPV